MSSWPLGYKTQKPNNQQKSNIGMPRANPPLRKDDDRKIDWFIKSAKNSSLPLAQSPYWAIF